MVIAMMITTMLKKNRTHEEEDTIKVEIVKEEEEK